MELRFDINKKLIAHILEEINDNNLPINCTTGKTTKDTDDYMIDVTFVFEDSDKPVFDNMMYRCINEKLI